MQITRKKNKDKTTLIFEGGLTIYNVSHLKDELFADCDSLSDKLELDLQGVGEIDTACVQLLLFAKRFFNSTHKTLHVAKTNELVDSVFAVLDVTAHFAKEN